MIKNLKKKKKAFTLVEVIIVLAIIAIIAAIAIPNLTKVRTESKIKADTQSAETIKNTMLMLITDDKIKVPAADTPLYLVFDINGLATGIGTTINSSTGNGGTDLTTGLLSPGVVATSVSDYFKGIKAPQSDSGKNYKITIIGTSTSNTESLPAGTVKVEVIKADGTVVNSIKVN